VIKSILEYVLFKTLEQYDQETRFSGSPLGLKIANSCLCE